MEEKKEKRSTLKKVLKYGSLTAAAVGIGYLAGNKEARDKVMGQVKNFGARFKKDEAPTVGECECTHREESRFNNDFNNRGNGGRHYQDRRNYKTEGGAQ